MQNVGPAPGASRVGQATSNPLGQLVFSRPRPAAAGAVPLQASASAAAAAGSTAPVSPPGSSGSGPSAAEHSWSCSAGDLQLDPLARALAQPMFEAAAPGPSTAASGAVGAQVMMERLLRRVSLGGDRVRGTARLEFGSGELAGGTLLIQTELDRVSLTLELPPGADPEWGQRLAERLGRRGLAVDTVEVRAVNG
jgi:hypothetical protein